MAQENRNTLKQYFETGKKPTEQEYANLVDSTVNNQEDKANLSEAQAGTNDEKYITPKTAKKSVEVFASGAIPSATISTQGKVELATLTEVQTGTDTNRAVTPEGAKRAAEVHAPVKTINGQTGDVVIDSGNIENVRGDFNEGILKYFTSASSTSNIFHIKLPYRVDTDSRMYHLKATGYAYNSADIIDIVWVGYCYSPSNNITKTATEVIRSTAITAGQYVGSDNHVYLWFKVPNTYYTTFKIDAIRVGNGTLLQSGDLEVTASPLATL